MTIYRRNCDYCELSYDKEYITRFCSRKCFYNSLLIISFHPQWRARQSFALSNEKNPNWSSDEVGYQGLHRWIRNHKEKSEFCENCGKQSLLDLANISGEYKREINDFKWLCKKCHMIYDGRKVPFPGRGENNHQAKLNEKQVRVIKWWRIINPKIRAKDIGKFFKVSDGTIYSIIYKKSWKHVTVN